MNTTEDIFDPPLDKTENGKLLTNYITSEGFGSHHIHVYDTWIKNFLAYDIEEPKLILDDGRAITFRLANLDPPFYTVNNHKREMYPQFAREQGLTYGLDIYVDMILSGPKENGEFGELEVSRNICIGNIPLMLKSKYCYLYGKSPEQLLEMGEDPKDPGGYFIVDGSEKVVLLQEQLAVNRIFLMRMDSTGRAVARMTSATVKGTTIVQIVSDKKTGRMVKIQLPSMRNNNDGTRINKGNRTINVLRIFRLINGDENADSIQIRIRKFLDKYEHVNDYQNKILLTLNRTVIDFLTRTNDRELIWMKMGLGKSSDEDREKAINHIINFDIFPHLNKLPVNDGETEEEYNNRIKEAKLNLLSIMIARYIEWKAGLRALDDRDSWSNKRVEGAGRSMQQLLRNAWRTSLRRTRDSLQKTPNNIQGRLSSFIDYNMITDTFNSSFKSSQWGVKGKKTKNNVAQTLVRDSTIAVLAHINTVDVSIDRTDKQLSLRKVQDSQWGFIDPVSTPEGENAGLVKNLGITARVSVESDDNIILRNIIGDSELQIGKLVSDDNEEYDGKVMINGKFIGWGDIDSIESFLKVLRRKKAIPDDTAIVKVNSWLYVENTPSRLTRPVLIVNENQKLVIAEENLWDASVHVLLEHGAMEYLSPWEQEYMKIAVFPRDIDNRLEAIKDTKETLKNLRNSKNRRKLQNEITNAQNKLNKLKSSRPYTHCEIDPQIILSVASSIIHWPDHNQAPRNTYQVSMGKQALGIYHVNYQNRYDGKIKTLVDPNRPLVDTEMNEIIRNRTRGSGQNVVVAFASFPYTEEDAFIFKKEFLENGGMSMYKFITYKSTLISGGDYTTTLDKPTPKPGENMDRYKYIQDKGPSQGLPYIGAPLYQTDYIICKSRKVLANGNEKNQWNPNEYLRFGDKGVVDNILITNQGNVTVVNVKLRIYRKPVEGDKYAPRNAQKGTIGLILPEADMPFSDRGITPDIIVNPTSIPSRMTLSYIMEIIAGKHAALRGTHVNGSLSHEFEGVKYQKTLREYEYEDLGYEIVRSGNSGKLLESKLYMGPVFFQALKHHVEDKIQARATGFNKPDTRQPIKGRGVKGGLRFGEMERDAALSFGASALLRERLMKVSDEYTAVWCINCGIFAVNGANETFRPCKICKRSDFGKCNIPYAYKLLIHFLSAYGINLRPKFATPEQIREMVFKENTDLTDNIEEELKEEEEENIDDEVENLLNDDFDYSNDL